MDIRHENAVHGLEHGAVWITYDPQKVSQADITTLAKLVRGPERPADVALRRARHADQHPVVEPPAEGDQGHRPAAEGVRRLLHQNSSYYPEIGASCENPDFKANPVVQGSPSEAVGCTDAPTAADVGSAAAPPPRPAITAREDPR